MFRTKQVEKVREVYRERKFLFGLMKVDELQRVDSIGTELRIACQKTPEKVILNGIEYRPSQE